MPTGIHITLLPAGGPVGTATSATPGVARGEPLEFAVDLGTEYGAHIGRVYPHPPLTSRSTATSEVAVGSLIWARMV